jgi:hypothetical protein
MSIIVLAFEVWINRQKAVINRTVRDLFRDKLHIKSSEAKVRRKLTSALFTAQLYRYHQE